MTDHAAQDRFLSLPCMKGEGAQTVGQKRIERRLMAALEEWFASVRADVETWAKDRLDAAAKKVHTLGPPLTDTEGLYASFVPILREAYDAGRTDATDAIGVNLTIPPEEALDFARERAAELVGKKWIGDLLVDNPDRKWCITDTLRDDINSLVESAIERGASWGELAAELRETGFGNWRAETIARTETHLAYGNGAVSVYTEAGVDLVKILDGPGCTPDGHEDGAPSPSGEAGTVEESAEADGQIWTLDQYAARIVAHPNCVRAAVPYVLPSSGVGEE